MSFTIANYAPAQPYVSPDGRPGPVKATFDLMLNEATIVGCKLLDYGDKPAFVVRGPTVRDRNSGNHVPCVRIHDTGLWSDIETSACAIYMAEKRRKVQAATAPEGEHVSIKAHVGPSWGNAC